MTTRAHTPTEPLAAPGAGALPDPARPLRVLIMSKIFPNRAAPGWAPFNRQQFFALSQLPGVQRVDVLATIPWFPGVAYLGARSLAAGLTGVPGTDLIDGLPVRHPRTLYLPRLESLSGGLYAASMLPHLLRYRGRVDVLLSAWAYPDGCAAVMLGRLLGVPVVVKLHGSDVNVLSERTGPRQMMKLLLPRAARIVSVSEALGHKVLGLGVQAMRVDIVRNGVDGAIFFPRDRDHARQLLELPQGAEVVVCVGRVEREKGVFDLLSAFALLRRSHPRAQLCLVGGGNALPLCRQRAQEDDLRGAVRLVGAVPLSAVPQWIAAADIVVMPSWAEGLPNTVLEAHACGRKVVATDVGGVGEVIDSEEVGLLVPPRDPHALSQALKSALSSPYSPQRIAAARTITWAQSAENLLCSLHKAVAQGTHA